MAERVRYLERPEDARGGLEDAVDAVGHVEAVGPVVVGHRPVVLLHSDEKSHLKYREELELHRTKMNIKYFLQSITMT